MAGDLIDIATARELVLAAVRPLGSERVPVGDALGRVLAEDLSAEEDLPPFDSSAMDGYAVIAGPAGELDVVDESRAGHPAQRTLGGGQAIAISTGALIPDGADAVVPVERVQVNDGRVTVPDTQAGANVRLAGAEVVGSEIVRDNLEDTTSVLRSALERADVVCVSGGVSVGPHDHVKPALASLGVEERFWRVALKPGKPTWFGARDEKLVFGLPGNPVSAMVTFHLFARPALRALAGARADDTRATAVLDEPLRRHAARDEVVRCRLRAEDDGWHVSPTRNDQGSHVLTSMLKAEAFALIEAGEGTVEAGERVPIELLR